MTPDGLPLFAAKWSNTSAQAAASIRKLAPTLRELVLAHVKAAGGATCDEIELVLHFTHQTASARVNELMRMGALVDSGKRRRTRSGRNATVWVLARKP